MQYFKGGESTMYTLFIQKQMAEETLVKYSFILKSVIYHNQNGVR